MKQQSNELYEAECERLEYEKSIEIRLVQIEQELKKIKELIKK